MKQKLDSKRIITLAGMIWVCSLVMASAWFINLVEAIDEVDRTNGTGSIFEGFYLLVISIGLAMFAMFLKSYKSR
jgi:hypothetical protein